MDVPRSKQTTEDMRLRCRTSRQYTRLLESFTDNLDGVRLTHDEKRRKRIEQFIFASKAVVTRGNLRLAQRLLIRAYAHAVAIEAADLAEHAAAIRVRVENILRNAAAIRLWRQRQELWCKRKHRIETLSVRRRTAFYKHVIGNEPCNSDAYYEHYVCCDLYRVVQLYLHLTHGRYNNAIRMLDSRTLTHNTSVYLQAELHWLRFRLHCTNQAYGIAQEVLEECNRIKVLSHRLRECIKLGKAFIELWEAMSASQQLSREHRLTTRVSTLMNSMEVISKEQPAMYLQVFIYEICRLLLDGRYHEADQRLAALRVRVHRYQIHADLSEVRLFLCVVAYVISTIHLVRRTYPHDLMKKFGMYTRYLPFAWQGIIPYSVLASKLLRSLDYR